VIGWTKERLARWRGPIAAACATVALLAPGELWASGARLSIQEAETTQGGWPEARVFVEVIGTSGAPIQGLAPELFRIYEAGNARSSKILKVQTIEEARVPASIVIVLQASGAWMRVEEGVKKALAGFIQGLAAQDRVAIVTDSSEPTILGGFSTDRGAQLEILARTDFANPSFRLYQGLGLALSLFDGPAAAAPGRADGASTPTPPPRAIVVISDGRDDGSGVSAEKVIAEALRRRIPIHAVGHSEVEQDRLSALEELARRTSGAYRPAPAVEEFEGALASIRDRIDKTYVIAWKTALPHDGKEHQIEVAMENEGGAPLRGKVALRTPAFAGGHWLGIAAAVLVAAFGAAGAGYLVFLARAGGVAKGARLTLRNGESAGKVYPLVGERVSLGSGPQAAIRLLDGAVSGTHAAIHSASGRFEIEDLGSKNGVLVNGRKTLRCELRDGDVITLGRTELSFGGPNRAV
jgi:VWFA-related protein